MSEEKKLDDMQKIFECADKGNGDIYASIKKVLEGKEYESEKFKASLDNWLTGYVSENNLTEEVVEQLEKDNIFYDKMGSILVEYIRMDNEAPYYERRKPYNKFCKNITDNRFMDLSYESFLCLEGLSNIWINTDDFQKLYDLVKYMKLEHVKTESTIEFPKIKFILV